MFSSFTTLDFIRIVRKWCVPLNKLSNLSNNNLLDYMYTKYKLLIFKELKYKPPLLSFHSTNSTNVHQETGHFMLEELFLLLSLPLDYNS